MHEIRAIDAHVAGAPVRLLVGGVPRPSGTTLAKRRHWLERHADQVRRTALLEPRGHHDLVGVLFTEPTISTADAGLVFMDAGGYPAISGAAIVAATTIALERGLITKAPDSGGEDGAGAQSESHTVRLDLETPLGLIVAAATVATHDGHTRVTSVQTTGVASYVADAGREVLIGGRRLRVDLAYSGAFYAIVDSEAVGIPIAGARLHDLRRVATEIVTALDGDAALVHPDRPGERALRGAIFTGPPLAEGAHLRSLSLLAHGGCDRSPSITDSGAVMSILHAMGLMQEGDDFVHEGLVGLPSHGRIVRQTRVADLPAIVPEVTASAWVVAEQTLIVADDDPLREGFTL
jgi:proline racemase